MRGRSEESRCVRRLDDLAGIHDGHALTDLGDDAKIVRDEEEGEAERLTQPAQQNENLELHGDVERRRGLVGDEEHGPARESERDHRALTHPT